MKKIIILMAMIFAIILLIAVLILPGLDANDMKAEIVGDELLIVYNDGTVINMGPVHDLKSTDSLDFYPLPDGTYGVKMGKAEYLEEITIPSHYKGCVVSTILSFGFAESTTLKRITIPDTVTVIETGAFEKCIYLEQVNMGNGVKTIEVGAFSRCWKLKNITLSRNLETIKASAFAGCSAMTELRIPEGAKCIEREAFSGCSLQTIVIPESVESIGVGALSGNPNVNVYYAGTMEQWDAITARLMGLRLTVHYESTP